MSIMLSLRIDGIARYVLVDVDGKHHRDLGVVPDHLAVSQVIDDHSTKTAWVAGRKCRFHYMHYGTLAWVSEVFD